MDCSEAVKDCVTLFSDIPVSVSQFQSLLEGIADIYFQRSELFPSDRFISFEAQLEFQAKCHQILTGDWRDDKTRQLREAGGSGETE